MRVEEGFRLQIQLKTPALLHPHLSLDALLAAALFQRTHDVDAALTQIPLMQRDGVWCGSSIRLQQGHYVTGSFTQALRQRDFASDRYTDHRKRGGAITVLIGGGQFKPAVDHVTPWIGRVEFFGRGDSRSCEELIESLPGIGAKSRATGYGRIEWIDVEPYDTDGVSMDGRPLRVVPVQTWQQWGHAINDRTGEDLLRFKPPYWGGERVPCVFPTAQVFR